MSCPQVYGYQPSAILAGVGIGIYALLTSLHLFRTLSTQSWDGIPFVLGGVFETIGYCCRLASSLNLCSATVVATHGAQSVLLTLGPTLAMFTVALTQTRFIVALHAERFVWVPIRVQRPIYLTLNSALLAVQLAGGIVEAAAQDMAILKGGGKAIVAAYVAQMLFWAFLLAENVYFSIRFSRWIKREPERRAAIGLSHWKWWNQLFGLAVGIIGFGRNLVRMTALGGVEFLLINEWPEYAFDGYQLAVVMLGWGMFYLPGKLTAAPGGLDRVSSVDLGSNETSTVLRDQSKGSGVGEVSLN